LIHFYKRSFYVTHHGDIVQSSKDINIIKMDRLSISRKLGYGLGHILNDLCASMWFTYLLLFFHKVLDFNNNYSGVILLVGQLADGISTTIVGALCDRQTGGVFSR